MFAIPWNKALGLGLACLPLAFLVGCDAVTQSSSSATTCTITANVTPSSASADHNLAPPGNQVAFTAASTVTGNCPLIADFLGSWSTSDTTNTTIGNQPGTQAVATCLHATPTPATIGYSGMVRGHTFTTATLSCK